MHVFSSNVMHEMISFSILNYFDNFERILLNQNFSS